MRSSAYHAPATRPGSANATTTDGSARARSKPGRPRDVRARRSVATRSASRSLIASGPERGGASCARTVRSGTDDCSAALPTFDLGVERGHLAATGLPTRSRRFLVEQSGTGHDGTGPQQGSWRDDGVGADAAVIADQGAELLATCVVQRGADANEDPLVAALVAKVADDAARLEV